MVTRRASAALLGEIGDAEAAGAEHALDAEVADQLRAVRQGQQVSAGRRAGLHRLRHRGLATHGYEHAGSTPPQIHVASFALSTRRTAPNAATNGTCRVRAIMWRNDGARQLAVREPSRLGSARWPCSCRHAPARICSEGLEMPPANIPAVLLAIALWGTRASQARGVVRGPSDRAGVRSGDLRDGIPSKARARAQLATLAANGFTPAWSRARPCTSSRRAREGAAADHRCFRRVLRAAGGRARLLSRAVAGRAGGGSAQRLCAAEAGAGIAEPTRESADAAAPLWPHPGVARLEGGRRDASRLAGQMIRIGRHQDNDIRLPDTSVHRYHAVIEHTPGGSVRHHRPERPGRQRRARQRQAADAGRACRRRRDRARADTIAIRERTGLSRGRRLVETCYGERGETMKDDKRSAAARRPPKRHRLDPEPHPGIAARCPQRRQPRRSLGRDHARREAPMRSPPGAAADLPSRRARSRVSARAAEAPPAAHRPSLHLPSAARPHALREAKSARAQALRGRATHAPVLRGSAPRRSAPAAAAAATPKTQALSGKPKVVRNALPPGPRGRLAGGGRRAGAGRLPAHLRGQQRHRPRQEPAHPHRLRRRYDLLGGAGLHPLRFDGPLVPVRAQPVQDQHRRESTTRSRPARSSWS